MSQQEFTIDGNTTLKIDTGNQGPGKVLISDANGMLDWGTNNVAEDGWKYVNNIIAVNGGSSVINLVESTHHMVVNNQGDTNWATNKVRLVLPLNKPNFTKVRITLMSEPWEVYVGTTDSSLFYSSLQEDGDSILSSRTKGPASLSTFTAASWLKLWPHSTVELTRYAYVNVGGNTDPQTRNYWILTNANGKGFNVGVFVS